MSDPVRLRPKRPCPICAKPSQQKFHPFCSARCAQVDLNRWLGGHYAIPAATDEPAPDEQPREAT
ncbi:MAG: DNA gyrase inhibitor YacG [Aestuariivirga sp.]|uniref:DNA gyrase inhibitor YacG n=1 Tax=Aestuariivirga sp. TaxID=2650926 RepID=UPI0038D17EA2